MTEPTREDMQELVRRARALADERAARINELEAELETAISTIQAAGCSVVHLMLAVDVMAAALGIDADLGIYGPPE